MRTLSLPNKSSLKRKIKHILLFTACHRFHMFTFRFFQNRFFVSIMGPDRGAFEYLEENGCLGSLHLLGMAEIETNCEFLPDSDRSQSVNDCILQTSTPAEASVSWPQKPPFPMLEFYAHLSVGFSFIKKILSEGSISLWSFDAGFHPVHWLVVTKH